jgi:hypothetical protein
MRSSYSYHYANTDDDAIAYHGKQDTTMTDFEGLYSSTMDLPEAIVEKLKTGPGSISWNKTFVMEDTDPMYSEL